MSIDSYHYSVAFKEKEDEIQPESRQSVLQVEKNVEEGRSGQN